jgi:hypothetical protein
MNKDLNFKELLIRNEIYNFGLNSEELKTIKKEMEFFKSNFDNGEGCISCCKYLVKKGGKLFGVTPYTFEIMNNIKIVDIKQEWEKLEFPFYVVGNVVSQNRSNDNDLKKIYLILYLLSTKMYEVDQNKLEKIFLLATKNLKKAKEEARKIFLEVNKRSIKISNELIKNIFWLFDYEFEDEILMNKENKICGIKILKERLKDFGCFTLYKIIKVLNLNENMRLSLSLGYDYDFNKKYKITLYEVNDEEYNYIDENRIEINFKNSNYFLWDDLNILDINFNNLWQDYNRRNFVLLDKKLYNEIINKKKINDIKIKSERRIEEIFDKKIKEKIKNIKKEPIIKYGIKMTLKGIYYKNQEISFNRISEGKHVILDIIKHFIYKKEVFDFNDILIYFTKNLWMLGKVFRGKIGQIKVVYEKGKKHFINDIRINISECPSLLRRAICFDKVEDYNKLLNKISRCSLAMYNLFSKGANIKISDKICDKTLLVRMQIVRKGNKNYLFYKDNFYPVKHTGHLMKNKGFKNLNRSISFLKDMFSLNEKMAIQLLKDGVESYKKAIKKSEQFLKETINLFNVKKVKTPEGVINPIKYGEEGYLIKGISGRKYFLTPHLKVFDYNDGNYICIVDKTIGEGFHNDKLVNRIYALANDSKIVKEVSTIG